MKGKNQKDCLEGDVEGVLKYDFKNISSSQEISFSYMIGDSKQEIREITKELKKKTGKVLLKETIDWWRKWLGYHEPSSEIEAFLQQGLLSVKTLQSSTGGTSTSFWWRAHFGGDASYFIPQFLLPYGNFKQHTHDVRRIIKFEAAVAKKNRYSALFFHRCLCDFSMSTSEADKFFYEQPWGELRAMFKHMLYYKATGDLKSIDKEAVKTIGHYTDYYLWQAKNNGYLLYQSQDSPFHNWYLTGLASHTGLDRWSASFESSFWLAAVLDFLSLAYAERKEINKFAECRKKKEAVLAAIEDKLVTREGIYGAIDPQGRLHGDITGAHLELIALGIIPQSRWSKHKRLAKERLLVTLPDEEGKKQEYIFSSPLVQASEFGVEGFFILTSLLTGDDELAKRGAKVLRRTASGQGTWKELGYYHGTGSTRQEQGSINYPWPTGVNVYSLFSYYIGLSPLEEGYDKPFQIHPHDLDEIIQVGKSFGAGISLQITRLDKETYKLKLPFLKEYTTNEYTLKAEKPIFNGKKKLVLSREEIIRGIEIPNFNNTKIIFTPEK